jgi:hypothetical protein
MADDLAAYLVGRGDAVAVIGFANIAEKPMNMLLHNGAPISPCRYRNVEPPCEFFFGASAPMNPRPTSPSSPLRATPRYDCCCRTIPRHARLRADDISSARHADDLKQVTLR